MIPRRIKNGIQNQEFEVPVPNLEEPLARSGFSGELHPLCTPEGPERDRQIERSFKRAGAALCHRIHALLHGETYTSLQKIMDAPPLEESSRFTERDLEDVATELIDVASHAFFDRHPHLLKELYHLTERDEEWFADMGDKEMVCFRMQEHFQDCIKAIMSQLRGKPR